VKLQDPDWVIGQHGQTATYTVTEKVRVQLRRCAETLSGAWFSREGKSFALGLYDSSFLSSSFLIFFLLALQDDRN
jgi:hypothetical protein